MDSTLKVPVMQRCGIFVASKNNLQNKQSSSWWFKTPWRACDVTIVGSACALSPYDIINSLALSWTKSWVSYMYTYDLFMEIV